MATPVFLEDSGTLQFDPSQGSDWDVAFLDNEQVPGLVTCVPKTARKIDAANSPGLDSATLRFQGMDPGTFSLGILVWTPEQQAALETLLVRVAPAPGRVTYANGQYTSTSTTTGQKKPASFKFYHPAAAAAGITTIVVESVTWYEAGPAPQSRTVTLECKQALPPKKTIAGTPQINTANLGGIPPAGAPSAPSSSSGARGP